jgi:hypothetical protein
MSQLEWVPGSDMLQLNRVNAFGLQKLGDITVLVPDM